MEKYLLTAEDIKEFKEYIYKNANLTLSQLKTEEIDKFLKSFIKSKDDTDDDESEEETVDVVFDFPGQFETYTITQTVASILIDIINKE